MHRAKWYELTPARKLLLGAAAAAAVMGGSMLVRSTDRLRDGLDKAQQREDDARRARQRP